jgi:heterodisulfide reductase subunit A-like polyferredoxin
LVEIPARNLGGKVAGYGCSPTPNAITAGLCAVGTLWEDVEGDTRVKKLCKASVIDISEAGGVFHVLIQTDAGKIEESFTDIVVASGFEDPARTAGAGYDAPAFPGVFTGNALEKLMKERGADSIFPEAPKSVAFLMCYGSRNLKERAAYCSRYAALIPPAQRR